MRTLALLATVFLAAGAVSAQSLGEIARRERERRAAIQNHAPIITNEDLKRERILPPQPDAGVPRAQSAVAAPLAPAAQPAAPAVPAPPAALVASGVPLWKVAEQPGFSLGEYARRLREQRARQAMSPAVEAHAAPPAPGAPVPLTAVSAAPPQAPAIPAAPVSAPVPEISLAEHARRLEARRRATAPPPPAPPADAVADPAPDPIRVRRGDSLWKLSAVYLGGGPLWVTLWQANPEVRNPNLIQPGQLLRWPGEAELARAQAKIERFAAASKSGRHVRAGNKTQAGGKAAKALAQAGGKAAKALAQAGGSFLPVLPEPSRLAATARIAQPVATVPARRSTPTRRLPAYACRDCMREGNAASALPE